MSEPDFTEADFRDLERRRELNEGADPADDEGEWPEEEEERHNDAA